MKLSRLLSTVAVIACCALPASALATPSTNFWAPSTPSVQPFGVLRLTYDSYFNEKAAYSFDTGLTIGVLPWKELQAEVGFDLFYPTVASTGPVSFPIVLNAKIGAPEDVYFTGQPGWSLGIFGAGFQGGVNNQNVLYAMLGKTFPYVGSLNVGGYYALNEALFLSSAGEKQQLGLLAGWASPSIDVPVIEKLAFTWDVQTGQNVLGATGGGIYVYFTPAVSLLTGPVFFFDKALQPGSSSWMWSAQIDVDIDFVTKPAAQ